MHVSEKKKTNAQKTEKTKTKREKNFKCDLLMSPVQQNVYKYNSFSRLFSPLKEVTDL